MKKVMVVDDSPFSRNILKRILKTIDVEILEAGGANEAIQIFQNEKPDLLMLDLLMPDKDGMELLQDLKKMDPAVKVVICSADKQSFRKTEAMETGASAFINKPVDPEILLETVKKHLCM